VVNGLCPSSGAALILFTFLPAPFKSVTLVTDFLIVDVKRARTPLAVEAVKAVV
jgi:hypothetical protein